MKHITKYLSTKIKNVNFNNTTELILKYFGIGKQYDQYQSVYDCIYSWCKDNYVIDENKIYPMCDLETFNDLTEMSDEFNKIKNKYNTSYAANEICQDELSKVKKENKVWIDKKTGLDIYYTENMIACLSTIGTIYCWNKDI